MRMKKIIYCLAVALFPCSLWAMVDYVVEDIVENDRATDLINLSTLGESSEKKNAETDHTNNQPIVNTQNTVIMRGMSYEADIMMLYQVPTCKYQIFVNGKEIADGKYKQSCSSVGVFKYSGYVLETDSQGKSVQYPFSFEYAVIEPVAAIDVVSNDVLYCGYKNEVEISVPGIPASALAMSVSNAIVVKTGTGYLIRPVMVGAPCVVAVSANIDGEMRHIMKKTYRTKRLPRPDVFLDVVSDNGTSNGQIKGGEVKKDRLLNVKRVSVLISDADFASVKYEITGFKMKFFNKKGEVDILRSDNEEITPQMVERLKNVKVGETFYVTDVEAKGPDRVKHKLPPMEIMVKE